MIRFRFHRAPRVVGALLAMASMAILVAPVVLAAEPMEHTGRIVITTGGDVTIPSGEQADAVIVVNGEARIAGDVVSLVVIDGQAILDGATTETVVAIRSPVELAGTTTVQGDVMTFDSTVTQASTVQVEGAVRDLAPEIAGAGFMIGSAMLLLFIGFGLAAIVAGLLVAALAARQVRDAEALIAREPILVLGVAVLGLILPIVLSIALMVTVVGAPLGFGLLFGLWPLVAFLGYLVAAIAIGDWILGRATPGVVRERPYLAAVVGVVVLQILSIVPLVGAIASLFGFGAVLVLAWRVATRRAGGSSEGARGMPPTAAPVPG